jgi:hypothetical protein
VIKKVHTGVIRIAMLASATAAKSSTADDECKRVLVVPTHIAFECHYQASSEVLVELGLPVDVQTLAQEAREECTPANRALVRRLTDLLTARLFPMTNLIPAAVPALQTAQKYSSKKTKGAGEKKAAAAEWRTVRMVDSIVCLAHFQSQHEQRERSLSQRQEDPLEFSWQVRVASMRKCCQVYAIASAACKLDSSSRSSGSGHASEGASGDSQTADCSKDRSEPQYHLLQFRRAQVRVFDQFVAEYERFAPLYQAATDESPFREPTGCSWDMTTSFKAMPITRTNGRQDRGGLDALRNFSHGAIEWEVLCRARVQDKPLALGFARLTEAAATAADWLSRSPSESPGG